VRRLPTLTKPAAVQSLPWHRPPGSEREAHLLIAEVGRKLADLEGMIKSAARRYPRQKAVWRGFIAKVRSDLAFLAKEISGFEVL